MQKQVIPSPLGPLTLCAEKDTLLSLTFGAVGGGEDTALFRAAERQLIEYFSGQRRQFDLPLAPKGTEFQRRVWSELEKIPYGETISYRQLAERAGVPNGFQAVGQANGRNPLPILIPCHRVITADGRIGGYAGGVERKRALLRLEGFILRESPKHGNGSLRENLNHTYRKEKPTAPLPALILP